MRIIPTRMGTRQPHHRQNYADLGSSPRVWGQVCCCACVERDYRDHPHACGDKSGNKGSRRDYRGSSPRVWGQVQVKSFKSPLPRIIPTRVGTSSSTGGAFFARVDHPHACGDKCSKLYGLDFYYGSSPRVWGQDIKADAQVAGEGIIPTRVGTSRSDRQG